MKEENHRRLIHFFISSRRQLKMALRQIYVLLFVVISMVIINMICFPEWGVPFSTSSFSGERLSSPDIGQWTLYVTLVILVFFIATLFSLYTSVNYSNRFVGPLLPIGRHIDDLIAGNFQVKSKVRADDEIEEVVFKLNKLSEALSERKFK